MSTPTWFTDAIATPYDSDEVVVDGARVRYRAWGKPGHQGCKAEKHGSESSEHDERGEEARRVQAVLGFHKPEGQASVPTCLPCSELRNDSRHERQAAPNLEAGEKARQCRW